MTKPRKETLHMNWKNVQTTNNNEEDIETLRADAKKYREQLQQKQAFDEKVKQIRENWQKEAEAVKRVVPEFDFEKAMQNEKFYNLIMSGESIPIAYLAINNGSKQESPSKRRIIVQNGQSTSNANGSPEMNVAGMSDEDFAKYLNKLKNR